MKQLVGSFLTVGIMMLLAMAAVYAAEVRNAAADHQAAALQVLEASGVDQSVGPIAAQMATFVDRLVETWEYDRKQQAEVDRTLTRVRTLIERDIAWNKIRAQLVRLYADSFNTAELQALRTFFASDVGRKYLQKMPELSAQAAAIAEDRLRGLQPEIQRELVQLRGRLGLPAITPDGSPQEHPPTTSPH